MKKKILIGLVLLCAAFCLAAKKSPYAQYAKTYHVSEYDIQKIIGLYVHSDQLEGYRTWSEYTDERWDKGYATNIDRVMIDGIKDKNANRTLKKFLEINDDGVLNLLIDRIEKTEEERYRLYVSYKDTRKQCGYIELTFSSENDVAVLYALENNVIRPINQKWLKTSGPLLTYEPLAGHYVVAPTPYSKDAQVYNTYEELEKAESERIKELRKSE